MKDDNSLLNIVFWNFINRIDFNVDNGMQVILTGKIQVYQKTGSYQFYANDIEKEGVGNFNENYLMLPVKE